MAGGSADGRINVWRELTNEINGFEIYGSNLQSMAPCKIIGFLQAMDTTACQWPMVYCCELSEIHVSANGKALPTFLAKTEEEDHKSTRNILQRRNISA